MAKVIEHKTEQSGYGGLFGPNLYWLTGCLLGGLSLVTPSR